MQSKNLAYILLSLATLVAGYAFMRIAYHASDQFPFTQEIVIIILGTVATIFITSLLLNKQTAVEIEKEQNVRYLDLKTRTYEQLLDLLEEMSLSEEFTDRETIRLQFITHKLSVIASAEVLQEYQSLLHTINRLSRDHSFEGDMPQLHESLASLTLAIRKDILGRNPRQDLGYSKRRLSAIVLENSNEDLTALDP
ncbi:MAG TPA: hypothetical protein ENJ09_14165 [Planctomycetes bacterium]|nr:hypothetical protein [Planctomycetota bacterium]